MALLIFAVAFAVRLVHIWQIRPSPFFDILLGDAHAYDAWARRLAAGDWIGTDVFYQAPLYPYFLGVVYTFAGPDLLTVRLTQAVIGSASCALLALAGARLFSKPVGLVAGLALALYAPAIFLDALLQKSVLDMFFVCLGLWLVSRILTSTSTRGSWMALGLAMGGLALTRENGLVLSFVILVFAVVQRGAEGFRGVQTGSERFGALRNAGWFLAGLAVVLLPVALRNYSVGGGLYLTTSQFGSNLYIGNHEGADGTYVALRRGRGAPEFERQDATEIAELALDRRLTPSEVSAYWTDRAVAFMTSRPGEWMALTGRKVMLLLNRAEMLDTESQESYAEWSWPLRMGGAIGHFGLLVPLAVAGAIITWPSRKRLWVIYALALAYAASVVVFYVFARYRYPLVPFLLLFAAPALIGAPRYFGSGARGPRLLAGAAVATAALVANWPLLSTNLMRAITENNLATALQAQGRLHEAIAHYQEALTHRDDYAPAYNNMGTALKAQGRTDEAIAQYRRALALQPEYPDARFNLANAELSKGQADDAVDNFREALKLEPDSVATHTNLAAALEGRGDTVGAIAEFREALRLSPRAARSHRNLGNALANSGDAEGGLDHLSQAARLDPSDAAARYDLGSLLLELKRFAEAAVEFEAALQSNPDSAEAMNNLGIALASQGRLADALTYFERALKVRPGFADARANRDQAQAALTARPQEERGGQH